MSGVGIYAKNWTNDMGVRTGPRPQEGVQNHFSPVWGSTFPEKKTPKIICDPEDDGFNPSNYTYYKSTRKTGLTTWGSEQACGHGKGSKNGIFPPWGGGTDSENKLLHKMKKNEGNTCK